MQLMLARAQCVRLGCIWVAGKTAQGHAIVANEPFLRPCPPFQWPALRPCRPSVPPAILVLPTHAPCALPCAPAGPVCQRRRLCRLFLRMDAKHQQHAVGGGGGRPEAGHVSACAYSGASCACCLVVTDEAPMLQEIVQQLAVGTWVVHRGQSKKGCTPLNEGDGLGSGAVICCNQGFCTAGADCCAHPRCAVHQDRAALH